MLVRIPAHVCQFTYLGVVNLACAEERTQRVVAGDDEAGKVDEEFSTNVEEDKEKVESGKTQDSVDLWNAGLLLEINEWLVL